MNLAQMIRSASEDHTLSDAHEVTERVFARIAEEDYPKYLYKLLRAQVTAEIARYRAEAVNKVRKLTDDDFRVPAGAQPQPTVEIDFDARPVIKRRDPFAMEVIREFWNRQVPVQSGEFKRMADLTADDCRYLAEDRYRIADRNYKMGQAYSKFAYELDAQGKTTLSELETEEVVNALKGELTSVA